MIHVLVTDEGGVKGEMRIERVSPSSAPGLDDYSVEFAADSGAGWVDAKRRMLYGFNTKKYNVLALVSEALNVLEFKDMEMTDADHPGHMARGQLGIGQALSREADDPERDH